MRANPFVSVIVPVRNEAKFIEQCLKAVMAQDYPRDRMEVIVVDGNSTDGTREILRKHPETGFPLIVLDNPQRIVPTALNRALLVAKGEVLVRVDGHCEIAPDYVRLCVKYLQNEPVDAVGGPVSTVGETQVARAIALGMSSRFGVGNSAFRTAPRGNRLVDSVAFPAYTRKAVARTGFFDEELVRNQDDEYNYRLRKLGGKILLAQDVRSRYFSRSSFRSVGSQFFQYGFWKVRVLQKHPRQMSWRQFAPPAFVAALALAGLLSAFGKMGFVLFAGLTGTYGLAAVCAAALAAKRHGWKTCFLLPLVFAVLHAAYGAGFWVGMLRFAGRWGDKTGAVPAGRLPDVQPS